MFRSKYEAAVAEKLDSLGVVWEYEPDSFEYVLPPSLYTPDFKVYEKNGAPRYIEVKGEYDTTARTKMALMKEQHPEVVIDFHFMRNNKLNPRSKTTYKGWANKHGYTSTVGLQELCDYAEDFAKTKVPVRPKASTHASGRPHGKGSRKTS